MIEFERFTLDNGLKVIFHKDTTSPMAVVNTLFDVGARDENPNRTGFAHLFEHLMFGGSVNISNFDVPLQEAGGSSNAFTSNDITNYYDVLPVQNLETALWLESDRMLSLAFTPKSLEVQRNVVIEEFKQRYLNQPYGDLWLEFRPLAYTVHPYQWATIGKTIQHIKDATMDEVKSFFNSHYFPGNAILTISGNLEYAKVKDLVEKWYGSIPTREKKARHIPQEPKQNKFRTKTIERDVPADVVLFGFKMPGRNEYAYYTVDLISDFLGRGQTSRLNLKLKKELELVTDINAYVLGSLDTGLLVISLHPSDGISIEAIENEIWKILEDIIQNDIPERELQKLINKIKTASAFSKQGILNKSMQLAFDELMGDANRINTEISEYEKITAQGIRSEARKLFRKTNCSQLIIKAKEQ